MAAPDSDEQRDRAELEKALAERDVVIAELRAKIEELTEKLESNSGNSHRPPSSDGPGAAARGKRRPSKKKKSKRKRGGQKGRRGAHRVLLPPERVDEFIDLFAPACEGCAAPLSRLADPDARRYQLLDWVDRLHVIEWRRHEVVCERCGHRTRAAYDADLIPASPFGPRLVAVVASLTGVYHLSRRRTQSLLREVFELEISVGTISKMEASTSAALEAAYDEACRDVEGAPVKHADGTTWLRAGVTMSLWTLATLTTTVYRVFEDGCRATIRPLFGRLVGILVSDRATVFGFWAMRRRQVCWAHLLRKFVAFSQRAGPAGVLGGELLDYAALVFDYWRGLRDGALSRDEFLGWMRPLRRAFEATLERASAAGVRRMSGSCADMLAHRDALWTFADREGVDPTNNLAERDLRPLVLWRKRSFGCQSERGLRFVERVMTVAHTARKRGLDVLDFIAESVTAHVTGTPTPTLAMG